MNAISYCNQPICPNQSVYFSNHFQRQFEAFPILKYTKFLISVQSLTKLFS